MSKILVAKLMVTVAALSALILVPGCSKEVDSAVLDMAWMPYNPQMPYGFGSALLPSQSAGASASQNGGTAGAVAAGGGGGGGQVSGGTALSQ